MIKKIILLSVFFISNCLAMIEHFEILQAQAGKKGVLVINNINPGNGGIFFTDPLEELNSLKQYKINIDQYNANLQQTIAQLTQAAAQKDAIVAQKDQQLQVTHQHLTDAQANGRALEQRAKILADEVAAKQAACAQMEQAKNNALAAMEKTKDADLIQLVQKLDTMTKQFAKAQNQLEVESSELAKTALESSERQEKLNQTYLDHLQKEKQTIHNLEQRINNLSEEIAAKQAALAHSDFMISTLKDTLAIKEQIEKRLQVDMVSATSQIADLTLAAVLNGKKLDHLQQSHNRIKSLFALFAASKTTGWEISLVETLKKELED